MAWLDGVRVGSRGARKRATSARDGGKADACRATRLAIPPRPLALTESLLAAGLDGVALLFSAEPRAGRRSFIAALPDRSSSALDPWESREVVADRWGTLPRWVGIIPYESRRALERAAWCRADDRPKPLLEQPRWQRYPVVVVVDHDNGDVHVVGDDPARLDSIRQALSRTTPSPAGHPHPGPAGHPHAGHQQAALELSIRDADEPEAHLDRVARARELIRAGDLYQVNLARRLDVALERGRPFDLFRRLVHHAPADYAAYFDLGAGLSVLSTSPELLLSARVDPRRAPELGALCTEPIKGTRPRGSDATSDHAAARELDSDPKERAELAMIVDVELSDLGSIGAVGSVRVAVPPHVRTHRSLHHRAARVAAQARPGVTRVEVLEAMIPSGSVTGAPKVRAMEVIRDLEPFRRGLYTGALGYVARDGSIVLAMAIRTLALAGRQGHYFTGGGIVLDSDPERELAETRTKALQLARACQ